MQRFPQHGGVLPKHVGVNKGFYFVYVKSSYVGFVNEKPHVAFQYNGRQNISTMT